MKRKMIASMVKDYSEQNSIREDALEKEDYTQSFEIDSTLRDLGIEMTFLLDSMVQNGIIIDTEESEQSIIATNFTEEIFTKREDAVDFVYDLLFDTKVKKQDDEVNQWNTLMPYRYVWTCCKIDDYEYIQSGFTTVNAVNYRCSTIPWGSDIHHENINITTFEITEKNKNILGENYDSRKI